MQVEKGSILCVLGPSGAGKSTLLHLLGGLDYPTQGEVVFKDKNLYALDENERAKVRNEGIGFVFQFYHLLSEFNALENVVMPGLVDRREAGVHSCERHYEVGRSVQRQRRHTDLEPGNPRREPAGGGDGLRAGLQLVLVPGDGRSGPGARSPQGRQLHELRRRARV